MSWLLIFISGLVPMLLLSVIVVAESLSHAGTKLCTVRLPVRGAGRL